MAYSYDQPGRLTQVDDGSTPITYTYNGDGQRATKTKSATTAQFTWDQSTDLPLLLAKDSTSYIYDDSGLPLEQIDAAGTITYLHHDRLTISA